MLFVNYNTTIMKNTGILMILVSLILMGCGQGLKAPEKEIVITESGYEMVYHQRGEGVTPQKGDHIEFSIFYGIGDSIMFDTRNREQNPIVQMPDGDDHELKDDPIFNAFELMVPGDSVTISQRGDQMEEDRFNLGSEGSLDFTIKLIDVMDQETYNRRAAEMREKRMQRNQEVIGRTEEVADKSQKILNDFKSGALNDEIIETETGLKYVIHEEGSGERIRTKESAEVHYYGLLIEDGTMFDNSFERGQTFNLTVGAGMVIQGWDEVLGYLNRGAVATVFIPYQLAYGEAGRAPTIPEKADLMFYMEVE